MNFGGNNIELEKTISYISNSQIICKKHAKEVAKTFCVDCNVYCCLSDNCAQPHILHNMENLDHLVNSQILPMMTTLKDVNKNYNIIKSKNIGSLKTYKNNLKTFAIEEKKKIDESYQEILNSLNLIYKSQLDDINDFIDNLSRKFDILQDKILSKFKGDNEDKLKDVNIAVNTVIAKSRNNEGIISSLAPKAKDLNTQIKEITGSMKIFNFEKEIAEIKSEAEKDYASIDQGDYFKNLKSQFEKEMKTFFVLKKEKENIGTISKLKRMVSMRQSIQNNENQNMEIDLDLFVRYLFNEINKLRKQPALALQMVEDYSELYCNEMDQSFFQKNELNTPQKIKFISNYLKGLVKKGTTFPPFEWDNDLSNSAEDYLKQTGGKAEKDKKAYVANMRQILQNNYFSQYLHFDSINYTGMPEVIKILVSWLISESSWNSFEKSNILFDTNLNVIGLSGVSLSVNKALIVLNLGIYEDKKN
jgi:hypothetical protein